VLTTGTAEDEGVEAAGAFVAVGVTGPVDEVIGAVVLTVGDTGEGTLLAAGAAEVGALLTAGATVTGGVVVVLAGVLEEGLLLTAGAAEDDDGAFDATGTPEEEAGAVVATGVVGENGAGAFEAIGVLLLFELGVNAGAFVVAEGTAGAADDGVNDGVSERDGAEVELLCVGTCV
jgi:hypothetical protein